MTECRFSVLAGAVAVAAFAAAGAQAQIPVSIEFRLPKAPTVATGDSGSFLAYELHITNLTPTVVALRRVDVVSSADTSRALLTVGDSALMRLVTRPGLSVQPSERLRIGGASRANLFIWVPVERNNPPSILRHRLMFQRLGGDSAGFTLEGAVTPVDRSPVRIGAPLRGEWLAANGPSNRSGHRRTALALSGTVAIGQRFGIDFLQVDESGRTFKGDSTNNAAYYAYGEPIFAVGDGSVVETKDSIPENTPHGPVARAVSINLVTVAGNHIVVDMGQGHFAFYAHVQPGSLRVKLGDRVKRGQVIGLVGNSGNSTEPHLHFHVVDALASGTSTLGAEGIPYALPSFDLVGRCTLGNSGIQCSRSAPITLKEAMPLQNQLVRFPE